MMRMKRHARGGRFLAKERGAFSLLDVHLSPTLEQRMVDLGLAPIPEVVARYRSVLRPTQFDQSLATKIVQ